MSRHRAVKNLNLEDEMDDDALDSIDDDNDYDDLSPEHAAQMASSLSAVQALLGPNSPITEKEIKDALWTYYFEVDESVGYLLDEQHKKEAAKIKAQEAKARKAKASSSQPSRTSTPQPSPAKKASKAAAVGVAGPVSQLKQDLAGMGLEDEKEEEEVPVFKRIAKEKILEELREKEKDSKPILSLVIVGHVDAGKSTLMGRLKVDLKEITEKEFNANQRKSEGMGKGSFAYAWSMDSLEEERARGVTIDVAHDAFDTPHRHFTLIDAPGHRDFIPNMISGAAQADTAILVIDGDTDAFEKGFKEGGQTKEHAVLIRSLGVQQLIVAVNKLDAVNWSKSRFQDIKNELGAFLTTTGFQPSKVSFVPVGAMSGENLVERKNEALKGWYDGPTLIKQLDQLDVPPRSLDAPLRIPISNVFKGQTAVGSGSAISGRIESGIVQTGERLRVLPGDGSGYVRSIESDGELVPWAVAGMYVTVYLSGIDALHLNVGSVLCPPDELVPLVSTFTAQIVVFDIKIPIINGTNVELFHHSQDIPATVIKIDAVLDKSSGAVIKAHPRMITKGLSAKVQVRLRVPQGSTRKAVTPLEPFSVNKNMGRILLRREGETIAAGIVLDVMT